jgi:hypothetical protein
VCDLGRGRYIAGSLARLSRRRLGLSHSPPSVPTCLLTPRRGTQAMLFQSDAQQVRAARLLHRVRWIRARFGHPPTSLKHGPTSPCITLAMVHGCSPCAFKASAMSWSAWDSNVHSDQIRACEKVCTRHDQWQLRRTAGHASVERRRAAAPALLMLASQHDCASSHVELF